MDVQHAKVAVADVAETVDDPDRGSHIRARPCPKDLVLDHELGFAVEHVERVDVVRMAVWLDALEVWPELQLDDLELGKLGEDAVVSWAARDLLAIAGLDEDAVHRGESSRGRCAAAA
jgi:hypothetical protein